MTMSKFNIKCSKYLSKAEMRELWLQFFSYPFCHFPCFYYWKVSRKTPLAHAANRSQMNEITWTRTSCWICFTYVYVLECWYKPTKLFVGVRCQTILRAWILWGQGDLTLDPVYLLLTFFISAITRDLTFSPVRQLQVWCWEAGRTDSVCFNSTVFCVRFQLQQSWRGKKWLLD